MQNFQNVNEKIQLEKHQTTKCQISKSQTTKCQLSMLRHAHGVHVCVNTDVRTHTLFLVKVKKL